MMKHISADMIPGHFWRIRYDQNHDPNTPALPSISESPNCQNFAYALLKHFGFEMFPFRSSNLWEDSSETCVVSDELRPLDLLLFNRTKNPWGAHVALYLGEDHAIHLSKKQSEPVIWPLDQFLELAEYRTFIGAKRLRKIGVFPLVRGTISPSAMVRLGIARDEYNGSASHRVADARRDVKRGLRRATGLNRSRGSAPGLATEARR
jgi:hypothetical protein